MYALVLPVCGWLAAGAGDGARSAVMATAHWEHTSYSGVVGDGSLFGLFVAVGSFFQIGDGGHVYLVVLLCAPVVFGLLRLLEKRSRRTLCVAVGSGLIVVISVCYCAGYVFSSGTDKLTF